MTMTMRGLLATAATVCCLVSATSAQMRITEYMYTTSMDVSGEFIEFTNVGLTPIDMSDWSYDDVSRIPGEFDLSGFGTVAPGESVIITETTAAEFRTDWGLPMSVKVLGGVTNNIGRNDEINLYDQDEELVDRLTYGDQDFPGTIRTNGVSGTPCEDAVGANNIFQWFLAFVGDSYSSTTSANGDIGNPGNYTDVACPIEPIGACCASGVCTVGTEFDCAGVGLYQGDDTVCTGDNAVTCPSPTGLELRVTEFMVAGFGPEFFEITNLDTVSIDLTGWSFSDEGAIPGDVLLSSLGTLAPGESAVITEGLDADFRTQWAAVTGIGSVPILEMNMVNIGDNDVIHLYDPSGAQVDLIIFGLDSVPASIVAEETSAWGCAQALPIDMPAEIYDWRLSSVGDAQNSVASTLGDTGSPGVHVDFTCPPQIGSCCVMGSCSELSPSQCILADGLYLGDDTNCTDEPCPAPSTGEIRITEFMYSGNDGEFVEFTNLGDTPVDMTGWSFADASSPPGIFDLSAFGMVMPGEVVILTEADAATFAANWGNLTNDIITFPENNGELGRNDTIRLFDTSGSIVDQLRYGDEELGSIRTQLVSGWPCDTAVGQDNIFCWVLSTPADDQNSFASSSFDIGNPGTYDPAGDCGSRNPACGESAPSCIRDCDCYFAAVDGDYVIDICDFHYCDNGTCSSCTRRYGNTCASYGGFVQTDDILCAVAGFGNYCACPNGDLIAAGGAKGPSGSPLGTDDILAVVAAFGGANPFACPTPAPATCDDAPPPAADGCGPAAASSVASVSTPTFDTPMSADDQQLDAPEIVIVPRKRSVRAGGRIDVDIYVSDVTDIVGYEFGLTVHGVDATIEDVRVDTARRDHVFQGQTHFPATDHELGRIGGVVLNASVTTLKDKRAYLGTFTISVPTDARGSLELQPASEFVAVYHQSGVQRFASANNVSVVIVQTDVRR